MKFVIILITSLMLVSCGKKPTNTIENTSAQTVVVEQQHKIVIKQLDYTCTLGNCITKYCIDGYEYLAFNGKDLTQVFYGQGAGSKPKYCGG